MNDFHTGMEMLRKSGCFLGRFLLPGLLLHAFPAAMLILSVQTAFLVKVQNDGFRFGSAVGLMLVLCGLFVGRVLFLHIRNRMLSDSITVFSCALVILIVLPPRLDFVVAGVAISGLFHGRTSAQRNFVVFGVVSASAAAYILGAAWFSPLIWSFPLTLAALLALAAAAALSAWPEHRRGLKAGAATLCCIACACGLSLYLTPEVEKIGLRWIFTPYGVLYGMDGDHGYKVYAADGSMLKNGDTSLLRTSVLPAILQCRSDSGRVLYVGYTPSELPALFQRFPNVQQVKILSFSGNFEDTTIRESPAHVLRKFPEDFDLIFVAELPPCQDSAKTSFLDLLKRKLTVDGSLVIPRDIHPADVGGEPLPGTQKFMTVYCCSTLIRSWDKLEARFKELCAMSDDGALSPMLLDTLKSETDLPGTPQPREHASSDFLYSLRPDSSLDYVMLLTGILYMLARIFIGRKQHLHFLFSAIENGFSAVVMLLGGAFVFSRYTLEYAIFPAALLMLIFLVNAESRRLWVCRLLRGCYMFTFCYLIFPFLRMNFDPMLILFPLLVLGAGGIGVVQTGITMRGKMVAKDWRWFFLGALLGSLLFAVGTDESVVILGAIALCFRVLYWIRL